MKTFSKIILSTLLVGTSFSAVAQDAPSATTDTDAKQQKCKEDLSAFYQFARQKNYADAYLPWLDLYNNCPEMSKNTYKYGVMILNDFIAKETDATKKAEYFDLLMKVYDSRIQYFGNDAVMPKARILGNKAVDYISNNTPNDPLKKEAYIWLGEAVNGLGDACDGTYLQYYIWVSSNLYYNDKNHAPQLIADYIKTNEILSKASTDANNPHASYYAQIKETNDQTIMATRVLSAETLDNIYAEKIIENKDNGNFLVSTLNLYKSAGATTSPVYFQASEFAHKIQPTEESAVGCANMYIQKEQYETAVNYLKDAIKYSTVDTKKAEYELLIASIMQAYLRNFSGAREHARASLELNPNQGKPYILIGTLYAQSKGIYSDPVLSKTVYWVAVDKFIKAKQVDPSCTEEANKLINTYNRYLPEEQDIFMHPDLNKGAAYTVGGWIGETTTCR